MVLGRLFRNVLRCCEEAELALDQDYDDWGVMRGPQPKSIAGKCVGDYYRRYNVGDSFSDDQLRDAVMKMCRLTEDLRSLGAPFHLQYREIKRVRDGLEEYLMARIVRGSGDDD